MKTIILRAGEDFSVNGRPSGTLKVYDEENNPLGPMWTGDWTSTRHKQAVVKELVDYLTSIDPDNATVLRAQSLIWSACATAEKLAVGIRAAEAESSTLPPAPRDEVPDNRPTVMVTGKELPQLVDEAWGVLHQMNRSESRFFTFLGRLADIIPPTHKDPPTPRLLNGISLKGYLIRNANWRKRKDDNEVSARPEKSVMDDMLEFEAPPLATLRGVVTSPYCAPSGVIITESGFNEETGLYLHAPGLVVPPVPERPTPDELARAVDLIGFELLGDFPFVTDADKCHAIAATFGPVVRPLIDGPYPLFSFEAPRQGTGKDLLAEAVTLPATGGKPKVMGVPDREERWMTTLTSILKTAPQVVVFTNLDHKLDSGVFSGMLTTTEWSDRLFNTQNIATFQNLVMWMITGNNPRFSDDIGRRVVRSRTDAKMENPWERGPENFRHPNLIHWAKENRPDLLWACLVIVRAWVAAGRPLWTGKPLGSFEQWSFITGGILDVAGISGFLENRDEAYAAAASQIEEWRELIDLWWAEYTDQGITAGKLQALAAQHDLMLGMRSGYKDKTANTIMGTALARMRDRVIGQFVVRSGSYDGVKKHNVWRLEEATLE